MNKEELKALPKILQEIIDVKWRADPIICDFYFDISDDSLYATTRGADAALYFPASCSSGVWVIYLLTGERELVGYIRHSHQVPDKVSFTPEGSFEFAWDGCINTRDPFKMNEYMQAEVNFAMMFFETGMKSATFR